MKVYQYSNYMMNSIVSICLSVIIIYTSIVLSVFTLCAVSSCRGLQMRVHGH